MTSNLASDISDNMPIFSLTTHSCQSDNNNDCFFSHKINERTLSTFHSMVENSDWQDSYLEENARLAYNILLKNKNKKKLKICYCTAFLFVET